MITLLSKAIANMVEYRHLRARDRVERFLYARAYRAVVPGYVLLAYLRAQEVDRQGRYEWVFVQDRLRRIVDAQNEGAHPPRALERLAVLSFFAVDRFLLSKALMWALGGYTRFLWPAGSLYRNVVHTGIGRLLHDASFYGRTSNGNDVYELVEALLKNSTEHVKDL